MGDIADMMLEGTLDEETGEYIGEHNLKKYGTEAPGFPVSLARETRRQKEKTRCPDCGKRVKVVGLATHRQAVHGA